MPKPQKIKPFIEEISLAFDPANRQQFIMRKDREDNMFDAIIKMLKDKELVFKEKELQEFCKENKISEEGQNAILAIAKIVKATDKHISDDLFGKLVKSIPEFGKLATVIEIKAEPNKEALDKLVTDLTKDLTKKIKTELEEEMDMGDKVLTMMKKDLESLKTENVSLKKDIQIEKDSRVKAEITSIVKDEHLPGEVKETVDLLFELKKTDEKLYDKTLINMRKTAKTLVAAGLFKEGGSSGDDTETGKSASDKLLVIAKDLRTKDSKLTEAQSMRMAGRQNPELYKEQTIKLGGDN